MLAHQPVPTLCTCAVQFRAPRTHNAGRLAEAVGLGVLTIVTMFVLSYLLGTCVDVPDWHASGYGYTFHCTEGEALAARRTIGNRALAGSGQLKDLLGFRQAY